MVANAVPEGRDGCGKERFLFHNLEPQMVLQSPGSLVLKARAERRRMRQEDDWIAVIHLRR